MTAGEFEVVVAALLGVRTAAELDTVTRPRWEWPAEHEALGWLRREELGYSPLTHAAVVLDHARWLVTSGELVNLAAGDRSTARSMIASGMSGRACGPSAAERGYSSHTDGGKVNFTYFPDGPSGSLRIPELLDAAAAHQTAAKVEALTAACTRRNAVVAEEDRLFGPYYSRTRQTRDSDAWWAHQERRRAADRALSDAVDAWWLIPEKAAA